MDKELLKKEIQKEPSLSYYIASYIAIWLEGAYMAKNYSSIKNATKIFKIMQKIFDDENKNIYLYRLISIPRIKLKKKMRLNSAKRPTQSWTIDLQSATNFYKQVYKPRDYKNTKRFQYLIIGSKIDKNNILFNYKQIIKLFKYMIEHNEIYKNVPLKNIKKLWIDVYKMINKKFLLNQKEFLCYIPNKINVDIIKEIN